MKVKDLIKALEQCDQESLVFVEALNTNEAKTVVQYSRKDMNHVVVYIADQIDYVDQSMRSLFHKKKIA